MKTKKILMVLVLPFLIASIAMAQGVKKPVDQNVEKEPAKRSGKVLAHLKQELALTPAQEIKVKELLEKREAEMIENREANQEMREEQQKIRQERMKIAMEKQQEHDAKMKAILTPEQYTKYEAIRTERREEFRENRRVHMERAAERRKKVKTIE